jgi:hypothetical protein
MTEAHENVQVNRVLVARALVATALMVALFFMGQPQVRGKAVPQRVRGDALLDASGFRSLPAPQAVRRADLHFGPGATSGSRPTSSTLSTVGSLRG